MKVAPILACAAIAVAATTNAPADESKSNRSVPKAVPYKNYWDANRWDPITGAGFWHEKQDRRTPIRSSLEKKPISPLLTPSGGSADPAPIRP